MVACVLAPAAADAAPVRGLLQVPPCRRCRSPLPLGSCLCANTDALPASRLSLQAPAAAVPTPAGAGNAADPAAAPTYFPLLATNLTSAFAPPGVGPFTGVGQGVTWEADPQFGQVLTCSQVGGSPQGREERVHMG